LPPFASLAQHVFSEAAFRSLSSTLLVVFITEAGIQRRSFTCMEVECIGVSFGSDIVPSILAFDTAGFG